LDGALFDGAVFDEAREIVAEGGVDDGVRVGGAGPQALEIFEAAAVDGDAR
jgi:hypothetical protein